MLHWQYVTRLHAFWLTGLVICAAKLAHQPGSFFTIFLD
jgi:hypothetical protein